MNPSASPSVQPHPELLHYIQTELAQGYTIDQIALAARSSGWGDEQIKVCIDWINNDYSNRQMSVAQTYASNAQYVNSTPISRGKRILGILGSLFIIASVLGASLLIYSVIRSDTSDALRLMIQKNLTTASFQRTLVTTLPENNGTLTAVCHCDLSKPSEPKAEILMMIEYPLGSNRNAFNQITLRAESIVIGDTVWMRLDEPEITIDDETRKSFATKTKSGATDDDSLRALYGIRNTNKWVQYFGLAASASGTVSPSLHDTLLPYSYGLATVFNDFLVGNFGTQSAELIDRIEKHGVYKVKNTSATTESFNNTAAYVSEVSINRQGYDSLVVELDSKDNFSERLTNQLSDDNYTGLIENFRVWIDEQGTLHKIAALDNSTTIIYTDFGATYDIQAPESEIDPENLRSIQEDLQRFPN